MRIPLNLSKISTERLWILIGPSWILGTFLLLIMIMGMSSELSLGSTIFSGLISSWCCLLTIILISRTNYPSIAEKSNVYLKLWPPVIALIFVGLNLIPEEINIPDIRLVDSPFYIPWRYQDQVYYGFPFETYQVFDHPMIDAPERTMSSFSLTCLFLNLYLMVGFIFLLFLAQEMIRKIVKSIYNSPKIS